MVQMLIHVKNAANRYYIIGMIGIGAGIVIAAFYFNLVPINNMQRSVYYVECIMLKS